MTNETRKSASTRRSRVDWDAVERDYRTTQLTLRELEKKHGITNSRIAQKAKELNWSRDLWPAIRQATDALLIQAEVSKELSKQAEQVTQTLSTTVITAAEIKAAVVMRHRERLEALARDAEIAREKLMALNQTITDVKDATTLVSAVEAAVRTEKILIEQERKAHRLDDDEDTSKTIKPKRVVIDFEDVEAKE
jgi:hypothetical protein